MYRLLLFLYAIFVCLGSVLLCMHSTNYMPALQIKKLNDAKYLLQSNFLNKCVQEMSNDEKRLLEHYKDYWAEHRLIAIRNPEIVEADIQTDCLKIVSEHQAKKFLCPSFDDTYRDDDAIMPYVTREYKKCVSDRLDIMRILSMHKGRK